MSKKSKRQVKRTPTVAPVTPAVTPHSTSDITQDYSHVKRDLRRIGLLAGIFFIILIVISIFQNQLLALFVK